MIDLEQRLSDRGFSPEDVTYIVDLFEEDQADEIRRAAARLVCAIFLRVEKDSAAGCALRRALGFSGGVSLSRAAKDFCVSKQYLETLQSEIERQLGQELTFMSRAARHQVVEGSSGRGAAGPSAGAVSVR